LVETNMAVADLEETQLSLERVRVQAGHLAQGEGLQHPALENEQYSRARPGHALEKPPAVNAVVVVIVSDVFGHRTPPPRSTRGDSARWRFLPGFLGLAVSLTEQ